MSHLPSSHGSTGWSRLATVSAIAAILATGLAVSLVLLSITDPAQESAAGYLPLAWSAAAVLLAVFITGAVVRRFDLAVIRGFPWLVGFLSFAVSFVPWLGLYGMNPDLGTLIYRGLKVPQGIMQFWDLSLVMQSVDCARFGFDIYISNNGCMQDPSIYAPGMIWVQYVPFALFSQGNVQFLGVAVMVASSLVLMWLARQSTGLGQIALAIAALGGPWLLLLERGNIDAVVMWSAAVSVLLVRRWSSVRPSARLWPWMLAALLLWLMGTWKYYPFALGVMLLPVLSIRRGWVILVGYAIASVGFVSLTWSNFRFSSSTNSAMVDYGDFVVLGRLPVVARMLGTDISAGGLQVGDVLLFALAGSAFICGFGIAMLLRTLRPWLAMLAAGGAALYLVSILVSGFGYGYKAVFLLLSVPLLSQLVSSRHRLVASAALTTLLLTGVQSVVVWNTVMGSIAGITAASFAFGLSLALLLRATRGVPVERMTTPRRTPGYEEAAG